MAMSRPESPPPSNGARRRVLIVDDEPIVAANCRRVLSADGHEVDTRTDARAGLAAALESPFDIVLLDLELPDLDGMEVLRQLKEAGAACAVIVVAARPTVESAVEAMKLGAADYLAKPFSPGLLKMVVQRVAQDSPRGEGLAAPSDEPQDARAFEGMLGQSRAMQRVFALIRRVAPTDGTVLVVGESGTGKEMVVGAIHRLSRRADKPLLACDCSALAPTLLESELFGHVKGSFSGAIATKEGLFQAAHQGTLFLDEVANLSMEIQGKLLRALETKRVKKVGDTAEYPIDIRLIAATNRQLAEMVRQGEFREDLYYRLNVVPIALPPLRQRDGDIAILADAFLARFCRKHGAPPKHFAPETMALLEGYHWPGNVRELRNIVERLAILRESDRIEPDDLPEEIRQAAARPARVALPRSWAEFKKVKQQARQAAVRDLEYRFLSEALERSGGNVSRAAESVGMQRTNFHKLMRRYGLTAEEIG